MAEVGDEVRACLTFFTRLPVGGALPVTGGGLRLAPLAGVVVGALCAAVMLLVAPVLPTAVAVGVVLAVSVVLTGALHEDGLMDVCDGFGLRRDAAETLRIMRDPHVGAFGVLGGILSLGMRWTALTALAVQVTGPWALAAVLIAAHGLSRAFTVTPLATADYVSAEGRSASVVQRMGHRDLLLVWLLGAAAALPGLATVGQAMVAGLAAAGLVYALALHTFRRRLGGYTGDCLGAIQQLTEIAFYLGVLLALGA